MDKFLNKYRIESARLKNWDYGRNAWYFVTICTGGRNCFFGEIINGKMNYSPAGDIARQLWMEIPNQFGYVNPDEYIVMPNHIHGIIRIKKNQSKYHDGICVNGATGDDDGNAAGGGDGKDAINRVSAIDQSTNHPKMNVPSTNDPTTKHPGGITGNYNPMLHDNLSRIIRWYKGRVSFGVRRITIGFSWQSRFHDRIIRNEKQLNRVRKYIVNNPQNWNNDEWHMP